MPFIDITNDFRTVLKQKEVDTPDSKRRKGGQKSKDTQDAAARDRPYLDEAYNILNHVSTLTRMLANVRTPYLNVDARPPPSTRSSAQNLNLGDPTSSAWTNIRYLTNQERDQIDMQAKVILMRCSDRVKEMENIEKKRAELVASKVNPLTRLLPARLRQDDSQLASEVLAAHHASILWYLSRKLAEASQTQKELQEERIKRQLERTKTLGSHASQEAQYISSRSQSSPAQPSSSKSTTGWFGSTLAATLGNSSSNDTPQQSPARRYHETPIVSDDEDDEIELSASQIMQFEAENANILRSVQDTLESVQQAEARLLDISALQMELVSQLTRQTELTDQLFEDALAATTTVEKGNEQLKEAKRRAKDSRLFILVFLVGASVSLLFLHYY